MGRTTEPQEPAASREGTSRAAPSIAHLLHRATQRADLLVQAQVALRTLPVDLTIRQYVTLRAVADQRSPNQAILTDVTGIDRSTMAEIVRRLQKGGLIERKRKMRDRRAYAIGLRPLGVAALAEYEIAVAEADLGLMARVPLALQAPLVAALEAIVATEPAP